MHVLSILISVSIINLACPATVLAEGDAARGKQLFSRCAACHSIEGQYKSGPALNGVFGRKAGAVEGYRYSTALLNSAVVWSDETLDAFLSGPSKMLRGTRMTTSVLSEADRADILAYLKTLPAR
ncbi:cytochrome c family protein [Rhizobium sp. MC63]|uniref:Cytochrome c family protein n=1 Tax=Rhizobium mulingense TaxID=3031128 RepID=A0ACC6MT66_9HYPH|nr:MULTISPECIES: cytochrome c family protein [unclassified Rhizobium]MDF0696223.1 cytochrome c family protein [Rhizobium sp. MC63]MEA3515956.1 cytochrome c family protein [Rhizobium sp. MJ31]